MKAKKILCLFLSFLIIISPAQIGALASDNAAQASVFDTISSGISAASAHINAELTELNNNTGVTYNCEWYIISMLRAGKEIDGEILNSYYLSVADTVTAWDITQKPTDIARVILALKLLDKDITDVNGVNLAELIYNNPKLTDSSNELIFALLAFDCANAVIPDDALWSRELIIAELLTYITENGGFGLYDSETADVDITAMCLQALAPYADNENVQQAVNKAILYLKNSINAEYTYSDNVYTAAQVLLAISALNIDVTNSENGFGDESKNIITAIEANRNTEGNGYIYDGIVATKATIDVMMAYDAYRKAHIENVSYWDFETEGAKYDDIANDNNNKPETEQAEPVNVYVTIAENGEIVTDKNGISVAMAPVLVTDNNCDGVLSYDEALYCAHEQYYDGGAAAGYSSFNGAYGLSLAILWGKGEQNVGASAGYYLNNASCWSLEDEVKEGDYLTAFNYKDTMYWSDAYTYFSENEVTAETGSSVTLTLNKLGYDDNYNTVILPCDGAKVIFLGSNNGLNNVMTADENGKVKISFASTTTEGIYYVMAYSESTETVPAVCKINVKKGEKSYGTPSQNTISGGGGTNSSVKKENNDETKEEAKNETKEETNKEAAGSAQTTETIEPRKALTDTTFADINKDDWHYDAVKFVYENNIMNGTEKGFEPDSEMSRAMLVAVLYRIANPENVTGTNIFTDVPQNEWYTDAVIWALENKIVNGVCSVSFEPNSNVTREQMAVILYRFAKSLGYDVSDAADISAYSDANTVSDFAIDAFKWANKANLINGTDDKNLSPKDTATRAEVATILMRFINKAIL